MLFTKWITSILYRIKYLIRFIKLTYINSWLNVSIARSVTLKRGKTLLLIQLFCSIYYFILTFTLQDLHNCNKFTCCHIVVWNNKLNKYNNYISLNNPGPSPRFKSERGIFLRKVLCYDTKGFVVQCAILTHLNNNCLCLNF